MSERTVHGLELTEYLRAPANGNVSLSFEDAVEAMKLAADEIERLRAARDEQERVQDRCDDHTTGLMNTIANLQAKLKAAEYAARVNYDGWQQEIARAALLPVERDQLTSKIKR